MGRGYPPGLPLRQATFSPRGAGLLERWFPFPGIKASVHRGSGAWLSWTREEKEDEKFPH
jgi:hypothetical protein